MSREQSYGSGVSGGEVIGRNPPVTITEGETTISWSWGYDGYEVAGFTGVVAKILQRSYPNRWSLQVADPLWFANIRRSDIATDPLNNIAASTAIEQILDAAGVTRMNIPTLSASGSEWVGSEWVLGTLTPVSWTNTTALAAAQDICSALGYWLYADASGVVRATLLERRPSDSPVRTLRWGEDFLLAGPPERVRDAATVKNRVVVRGANTGVQGAQIWDEWVSGDGDRSLEFSSFLIEYVNEAEAGNASATAIAKRILRLWSRQPSIVSIPRLKADPRLAVGQTVAVECDLIGYATPTPFFVYGLNTSLDLTRGEFVQSITLDGGIGDQGYTTIPPPEASFTWRIVRETLGGTGVVELFLDGTGSVSLAAGEIVSWSWTTATTTALSTPTSATGPQAVFIYPGATTSASVTLTVTDTSSKTGTLTQTIALTGDELTTPVEEVVSLALGSAWAVTPDGGATWNVEATGDSILVPERSGDTLLSTVGTGGTGLRGSDDALSSASETLVSLGGAATAMSVTPDTQRVWIGVGASLYLSTDNGATKALWGTLPASIAYVLEDPAVLNSVFVLAGANLYHATTETPGTAWSVLYAGPSGATARQMVRGQSGATTWICYTGTFTGSPLQRVEGPISALFDPAVAEIRAIALSPDELTVYAWDADGLGYSVVSATGVATATGADTDPSETPQHALYSEAGDIVYLATFGATEGTTYKYFPLLADSLFAFYTPSSGQQAHRVGIGNPSPLVALLYAISSTSGGGTDGVYKWAQGIWGKISSLPVDTGWFWFDLLVSPLNDQHMLLRGNSRNQGGYKVSGGSLVDYDTETASPLWLSTDGGLTWSEVTLNWSAGGTPDIVPVWSATTAGAFAVVGQTFPNNGSYVWRLTTASPSGSPTQISASVNHYAADAGTNDELVIASYTAGGGSSDRKLSWLSSGGATLTQGAAAPAEWSYISRVPGSRAVAGLLSTDLYYVDDYRAGSTPVLQIAGIGGRLVAGAGGVYVATSGGVKRVTGVGGGSPVDSVVAASGVGIANVVGDAATRVQIAAVASDGSAVYVSTDGETWRAAPAPTGIALNQAAVAVVKVGT